MKKLLSFITDFNHKIIMILLIGLIAKNADATTNINNTSTTANTNNTNATINTNNTNKINTEAANTDSITITPINAKNTDDNNNKHMHSKQIQNKCMQGLVIFKERGECISYKNLTVLYVLKPNVDLYNSALVREEDAGNVGLTMLIVDNIDRPYYDGQNIKLPENKCFRIIGTYRYRSKDGYDKTVPVVVID